MPNNTQRSAAVPFVNQKGERSMKRVKVPRYFAGKKPAYANEDDEDEEYITDDEDIYEEEDYSDEQYDEEDDYEENQRLTETSRKLDHLRRDSDDESSDAEEHCDKSVKTESIIPSEAVHTGDINDTANDEDEDDDPRFRRLKQIEKKTNTTDLINIQRTQHITSKYELGKPTIILDEDDDEDEIRQRHALARRRKLEEPLGPKSITGAGPSGHQLNLMQDDDDDETLVSQTKLVDTEDLLKDIKLTGISRPLREKHKTEEEQAAEQLRMRELLETAKKEAAMMSQIHKKVEDDIRRENEKEALAKGAIGSRELSAVITDDEDDELAYEEWKYREIKRVQRDRSERLLFSTTRTR